MGLESLLILINDKVRYSSNEYYFLISSRKHRYFLIMLHHFFTNFFRKFSFLHPDCKSCAVKVVLYCTKRLRTRLIAKEVSPQRIWVNHILKSWKVGQIKFSQNCFWLTANKKCDRKFSKACWKQIYKDEEQSWILPTKGNVKWKPIVWKWNPDNREKLERDF